MKELIKSFDCVAPGERGQDISKIYEGGKILSGPGKRLLRWDLQREVRALLPNERVAFCMRRMQSSTVEVMYSPGDQSAHYKGLMACGSVWVCPVCSARISEKRRQELEKAIDTCIKMGGSVYLVTYTVAHNRYDDLEKLLHAFLSARRKSKQGWAMQELRKRYNILGTISVQEVTWSKLNGWHPHCHELVFFASEIDVDDYTKLASNQWRKAAEHMGLCMNEHGFDIVRTYGAAADYVAKYGREPVHQMWGAAAEMTKTHLKSGRMKEHLTPFTMLALIAQGCNELKPLFREYARCFKGKHQLVWSAHLRSRLQVNIPEKTDLELAEEPEEKVVLLGSLTREQWRFVLLKDVRGHILEIARSGDWGQVTTFLAALNILISTRSP